MKRLTLTTKFTNVTPCLHPSYVKYMPDFLFPMFYYALIYDKGNPNLKLGVTLL